MMKNSAVVQQLKQICKQPELGLELIREFEEAICASHGGRWAVGVNGCTSGILSSLMAVGVQEGDEIIVPALSWGQTWFPAMTLGATLVVADLSPDWPVMDAQEVERLITPKTKAVVSVGLWGYPFGLYSIDEVCRKHNLPHVVDAAQLFDTGRIGEAGDLVVLSFGSTKALPCGEGGMVLVRDNPDYHDRLLALTQHPFRLHSEGDSWFSSCRDGCSFNFKLHPLSAFMGLKMGLKILQDSSETWVDSQVEVIVGTLLGFGLSVSAPPGACIVANCYGCNYLLDAESLKMNQRNKLRDKFAEKGIEMSSCSYRPFAETVGNRNGLLFPWHGSKSIAAHFTHAFDAMPYAVHWANNLEIIHESGSL